MPTLTIPLMREQQTMLRRLPRMLHGYLLPKGVPRPHWTNTDVIRAFLGGKDEDGRIDAECWAMNVHWSTGYKHALKWFRRQQERRRAALPCRYTAAQLRTWIRKLERSIVDGLARDRAQESRTRRENHLQRVRERRLKDATKLLRIETARGERLVARCAGGAAIKRQQVRLRAALRRLKRCRAPYELRRAW